MQKEWGRGRWALLLKKADMMRAGRGAVRGIAGASAAAVRMKEEDWSVISIDPAWLLWKVVEGMQMGLE